MRFQLDEASHELSRTWPCLCLIQSGLDFSAKAGEEARGGAELNLVLAGRFSLCLPSRPLRPDPTGGIWESHTTSERLEVTFDVLRSLGGVEVQHQAVPHALLAA